MFKTITQNASDNADLVVTVSGGALSVLTGILIGVPMDVKIIIVLSVIGFVIGLGQALLAPPPFSVRLAIGRALVSCGLAFAGGIIFELDPDANPLVCIGAGALLASCGTDFWKQLLMNLVSFKKELSK